MRSHRKEAKNSKPRVDNTNPLYWIALAVCHIGIAGAAIYCYFTERGQAYLYTSWACVAWLPFGLIINLILKLLGCWSKPRTTNSKLGGMLFAPALVIPACIIGVPIYYFLHFPVLLCFDITSAGLVLVIMVVDASLNMFREQFTMMFVLVYNFLYTVFVEYILKRFLRDIVFVRYVLPVLEWLWDKFILILDWLHVHVFSPLWRYVFKPVLRFIFKVLKAIYKFFKAIIVAFYKYVLSHVILAMERGFDFLIDHVIAPAVRFIYYYILVPTFKVLKIICQAIYDYFLKYVIQVIEMQYMFISNQLKLVFSLVFSDANGVVNYFISIPLVILAVAAGVFFYLRSFFISVDPQQSIDNTTIPEQDVILDANNP